MLPLHRCNNSSVQEKRIAVEPLPSDTRDQSSSTAGPYRPAKPRARVTPSEQRRLEDATHLKLETPVQVRLGLQRRAPHNLRRHLQRALVRFAALLIADLAAFGVMRELIRAVREHAALGAWIADGLQSLLPAGHLNGWQYAAALFLGLLVLGNYGPGDRRRDPWRLFLACALATALPLWMSLWTRGLEPVLVQYALTTVLVWAGVAAERLTLDGIIARVRDPQKDAADVLFVGPAADCNSAAASPAFGRDTEYRPIGFVDTQSPHAVGAMGEIGDLPILLAASGAEVVVVCGFLPDKQFREVVETALAGGCHVLSVPRVVKVAGVHPTTVWRRGQPLVELTTPSLKGWQLFLKRTLDLIGASSGLLLLSPLIALIGVAIKLESGGPIIFGHDRLGANGRRFKCYKFRSMHRAADQRLGFRSRARMWRWLLTLKH